MMKQVATILSEGISMSEAEIADTTGQVKENREILLKGYPFIDLLPIPLDDHDQIDKLVKSDETGDTLFNFLWRELSSIDKDEVIPNLEKSINDLSAIYAAFQVAETDSLTPSQIGDIIRGSYPDIDLLPLGTQSDEDIEEAIQNDETGDTLFKFIWRELCHGDCPDPLDLIQQAINDLANVLKEFQNAYAAQDDGGTKPAP